MSEVSSNDHKHIYLLVSERLAPPPPVGLNGTLLTLSFCCHAARLHLAHHFALQLLSLKAAVRTPHRPTVSGTAGIRP